ncbi:MAG: S41 family peptidase [Candidatus Saccharimonadales bacterium]
MSMTEGGNSQKKVSILRRKPSRFALIACICLILSASFLVLGINIGNGNINLGGSSLTGLPAQLNYTSVNQVYTSLRENYDGKLSETQVLNGIKEGIAASTNDPYTEYFTPAQAAAFNNQLNNSFSGIGAELSENSSGTIQIIAPISGTPAAKAGLQAGDLITSINGQSTNGITVDQAVNLIRGKSGTKVTLGILRGSQQLSIGITRENITVPSVNTKILNNDIGYMQISTFANDTSALAQKDAQQFVNDHVKGIVLDLRDDPGGLLTAAINVSSLWVPNGKIILSERRGSTIIQTYYSEGGDILNGIPTVVLINGGSASASEITTGALHDNGDAYVIGNKSYGKGVVQQLINFGDGSELKVTIASWYRPNGQNINKKGIIPDENVNLTAQDVAKNDDTQLNAALSYLASH